MTREEQTKEEFDFDLAVSMFLAFHDVVAQEDVKHQCKDAEKCFLLLVKAIRTQEKRQVIKMLTRRLEREGVKTPSGKLTPQQIEFVIAKLKEK